LIMNLLEYFLGDLVLFPLARRLVRDLGCPPDERPSPPPIGWSTGFMATPLTLGLFHNHLFLPAFPKTTFMWSPLETVPIVAIQAPSTNLVSPEGNLSVTYFPSRATIWA